MKKMLLTSILVLIIGQPLVSEETPKAEAEKPKAPPAAAPTKSPAKFSGEALALKKHIEVLFDYSKHVNISKKEHRKFRAKMDKSIDWNKIAVICIGQSEWNRRKPKQRSEYKRLLKDIVSLSAYSRMEDFWDDVKYEFTKIDIHSNTAHVKAVFSKNSEDGDEYTLEYYFVKKKGKWLMYDLAYEELRYSETINDQITTFLEENSFAELLKRLRKRRKEVVENEKNPKDKKTSQKEEL